MQIELETKVKQATINAQVRINAAEGKAQATVAQNTATTLAFYNTKYQEAESYGSIKGGLNLTNE